MWLSQDGRPTHSLPWGFEQTWSKTHPSISLLAPGISSFFPLCNYTHRSPNLWPPENRSTQPHSWPPTALARSSLSTRASYSASLLVAGKSRQTIHSILSPSGEQSTIPTLPTCLLDNPSIWILHWGCSLAPWPSMLVNSTMKSATTCPFMAIREQYYTSNSLNSIAHSAIRPVDLGLLITRCKGLSIRTTTVWA